MNILAELFWFFQVDIICSSWACYMLPESWITKCGSKLIYELLPEKRVVYVLPIASILGRLPVVQAGDTGRTIQFKYRTRCSNGTRQYDSTLAKADTSPGAEDGCLMYFVNSWALGLPCNSWLSMKRSVCPVTACVIAYYDKLCWWCIHYFTLLHISTFDIFDCYYMLLQWSLLHCYYIF